MLQSHSHFVGCRRSYNSNCICVELYCLPRSQPSHRESDEKLAAACRSYRSRSPSRWGYARARNPPLDDVDVIVAFHWSKLTESFSKHDCRAEKYAACWAQTWRVVSGEAARPVLPFTDRYLFDLFGSFSLSLHRVVQHGEICRTTSSSIQVFPKT